jgi:hypothetical protein
MLKKGFATSEFWLNIIAGAICGGAYYLGHPLDNEAVFGLCTMVGLYTWKRLALKQSHSDAYQASVLEHPQFKSEVLRITKNIADAADVQGIKRLVLDQVIKSEVGKL